MTENLTMNSFQQSRLVPEPFCIISTDSAQENPNKLFLGGVPPQATEKQLEDFFTQFGVVRDVRIVTDRITAECKGYGFVTFDEKEDIEHLVERKTIRMNGKKIRIRKAIRRNGSQFDNINTTKTSNTNSENPMNTPIKTPINNPPVNPTLNLPSVESSSPIMIPTESFNGKSMYVPPPSSTEEIYEPLSLSNFSPSQMVMSPLPDIELHNQQCGMQMSPMSPAWVQHNYQVVYVPNPMYSNSNTNWVCY